MEERFTLVESREYPNNLFSFPLNQDGLGAGKATRMGKKKIRKYQQKLTFMAFSLFCSKILNSRTFLGN